MLASERGLEEANARIASLQVNTEQNAKQLEVCLMFAFTFVLLFYLPICLLIVFLSFYSNVCGTCLMVMNTWSQWLHRLVINTVIWC